MIDHTNLQFSSDFLQILTRIDEFKGRWKALTWLSPEILTRLRRIATIESVGSSTRIEGSKLTDQQVATILDGLETQSFATRDEQEVAGYASAMNLVFDAADLLTPTENHLFQLHGILLQFSEKDVRHRGGYKTLPNNVGAFDADGNMIGIVFETTTPFDTPREMKELLAWIAHREALKDLHPIIAIGMFVVVFLKIHPFQDGNGRLSRILTTLLLLRAGYSYAPYASMEAIVEQNKESYYRSLRATQQSLKGENPDWRPWLAFFLQTLDKQRIALEAKVAALELKISSLSEAERRLLDRVESAGRITVAEASALKGESRNTVRKRLAGLVAKGFLALEGRGRGSAYRKR